MKYLQNINEVDGGIIHDTLNPSFWTLNSSGIYEFDQGVRDKLMEISADFWSTLGLPDVKIHDVQLTGSLANYNYHPHSDLDTHIIIDYNEIDTDFEIVHRMINTMKWKWNKLHPIVIRGAAVEMYVQDVNDPHTASGLYSLMKDEWIVTPKPKSLTIDAKDVQTKADYFRRLADWLINEAPAEYPPQALMDYAKEVRKSIARLRKDAFDAGKTEFSVENLAFKQLRNDGTIKALIDFQNDQYNKHFSESNQHGNNE